LAVAVVVDLERFFAVDKESKSNHIEQSIKSSSKRITKYTADGKPIVNQSE
jgi:hypothetical protein